MEITPASVLAMWAAGIAGGSALVSWWGIVGRGYGWLSGGTALLFGVPAALSGGSAWAVAGCVLAGLAMLLRGNVASAAFGLSAAAFAVAATFDGGVVASLTGAVLLGAVTVEMMLGHWFLVDPRLPRWSLRRLDLIAGGGAVLDAAVLVWLGAIPWAAGDAAAGVGYLALVAITLLLIAAVWSSLGEEGYPAVMAATGLSYLAVLTSIGAAVLGRLLAGGAVLS